MLYYFAYGSNLHPVRLIERVPSARLLGPVCIGQHQLKYHKRSHDGSGKCNILYTENPKDKVYGALYSIQPEHKQLLDHFEGLGYGYIDDDISVELKGKSYQCFTYRAQNQYIEDDILPYHWYRDLVLYGAKYLGFPEDYIQAFVNKKSIDDPDSKQSAKMETLVQQLLLYQSKS